jgi:hypothetical protein
VTLQEWKLPGDRISFSAKNAWQTCGWKYNRSYILGARGDPSTSLVVGSAYHSGQQYAANEQIHGRPRPAIAVMQDYVGEAVFQELTKAQNESRREIEWKEGESLDTLKSDAVRAFTTFERDRGHALEPETIEEYFRLEFENRKYLLTGKLDVWTRQHFVRDFKLTRKKPHALNALMSDQLTGYQIWKESQGFKVAGLALDHIVLRKKDEEVVTQEVPPRTPEQIAAFLDDVDAVVRGIRAGCFPKVNNWQICSWCQHLRECHPDWYEMTRKGENGDG